MELKEYLKEEGITQDGFARFLGVSRTCIANFCQKRKSPSLETANFIVAATKGKVTFQELLSGKKRREKRFRKD